MRGLQFLCLLTLASLFALTGLRQFFFEPLNHTSSNIIWFTIQVAPLLLVLPGILRRNYVTYVLTTLVSMLYFIHGVLLVATPELRTFGLWEVAFAIGLIAAAAFGAKYVSRAG